MLRKNVTHVEAFNDIIESASWSNPNVNQMVGLLEKMYSVTLKAEYDAKLYEKQRAALYVVGDPGTAEEFNDVDGGASFYIQIKGHTVKLCTPADVDAVCINSERPVSELPIVMENVARELTLQQISDETARGGFFNVLITPIGDQNK